MGNAQGSGLAPKSGKVKGLIKLRGKKQKVDEFTSIVPEDVTVATPSSYPKPNECYEKLQAPKADFEVTPSSIESSSESYFTEPPTLTPVEVSTEINQCYLSEENVNKSSDTFFHVISDYNKTLASISSRLSVSQTSTISIDNENPSDWYASPSVVCVSREELDEEVEICNVAKSDDSVREYKRFSSMPNGEQTIEEKPVIKKVTSLILDKVFTDGNQESVTRPKFVPEKLDFKLYEKFEGYMLMNWFISEFPEDHQLRQLLKSPDLKLLAIQFCTHLLAAGVLHQIPDKDLPMYNIFKPDLMYYWAHSEMPISVPQTPGRLNSISWPPSSPSEVFTPSPTTHNAVEVFTNVNAATNVVQDELDRLRQELEKYKTLSQIQDLTAKAVSDFGSPVKDQVICDICRNRRSLVDASTQTEVYLGENLLTKDSVECAAVLPLLPPSMLASPDVLHDLPTFHNAASSASTLCDMVNIPPPPPPPPLPTNLPCDDGPPPPPILSHIPLPPPLPPVLGDGAPPPPPLPVFGDVPRPPPLPSMGNFPPPPPFPDSNATPLLGDIPCPPPIPTMGNFPPPPPLPNPNAAPPPPPMFNGLNVPPPVSLSGPAPLPPPPVGGWNSQKQMFRKNPVNLGVPMKPLYWTRVLVPIQETAETCSTSNVWITIEERELPNMTEFTDLFSRQIIKRSQTKKSIQVKSKTEAVKLLDSKRSQNVGILAQSLHVDFVEIENAIYNFDTSVISLEALQQIYEVRATPDELLLIQDHLQNKTDIRLDKPEHFLYDLSQISNFAERISCFMYQIEFDDSISRIRSILANLKSTCEYLIDSEPVMKILSIILTLGNYMNGGNMTRGQADGYGLEILGKLKDVKSNDSQVTLLHFVVRTYMKNLLDFDETLVLPTPEPEDVRKAGSINFDDINGQLEKLQANLKVCTQRTQKVKDNSSSENLHPFEEKMTEFLDGANQHLETELNNLVECREIFLKTMKSYSFKPKTGGLESCSPCDFFDLWSQFCYDFKEIWKSELIRHEKERFDELRRIQIERRALIAPKSTSSRLRAMAEIMLSENN